MNVLMISPGFPEDLAFFTRGLAQSGARVFGLGDQPTHALPPEARANLAAYLQVASLWEEDAVVEQVREWLRGTFVDRVECLWEPGVVLAAKLRGAFGAPGLTVEQAVAFRDKDRMKAVLDDAGVRTPRHARATTRAQIREYTAALGYPVIVKPIAGAGSADTYPIRSDEDLEQVLGLLGHVDEVSVEEFIEGEEFTFDTVSANGEVLFHNIAWYRPGPLTARLNPWISPQAICLRDTDTEDMRKGRELGHAVLKALGFESGFTHMEWFLTKDGEAVFGEIGARAPGGRMTHGMNYSADIDLFRAWGEAIVSGTISQDTRKRYNACLVFKRAVGNGIVTAYEGLDGLLARYGEHVAHIDLTPIGSPARDYRKVVTGDGWIIVRHPDLGATIEISNAFSTQLRVLAAGR